MPGLHVRFHQGFEGDALTQCCLAVGTGTCAVPAVEVLSAHKTYPNGTVALQPVDLTVQEGEFVSAAGAVGLWKEHPAQDGGRPAGAHRWPVAAVAQTGGRAGADPAQAWPSCSSRLRSCPGPAWRANVRLPLDFAATWSASTMPIRGSRDALALVGLEQIQRPPCRATCRAVCRCVCRSRAASWCNRNLLLMDEPFGALDEITRHKLDAELLALVEQQEAHGDLRDAFDP